MPDQRRPEKTGRRYRPAVYWHCFAWHWLKKRADWSFSAARCCYPVSWSLTGLKRLSTTTGEYLPDQRRPEKTGRRYRPAVYWHCFAWHWLKKRADWSFSAARCCYPVSWSLTGLKRLSTTTGEYLPDQRRPEKTGRRYRPAVYWHCFAWHWLKKRADWSFSAARCCYPVSWSLTGLKRLSTTTGEYLPDQRRPEKTGRRYRPAVYWHCFAWHWLKKRADWSFSAARCCYPVSWSLTGLKPLSTTTG